MAPSPFSLACYVSRSAVAASDAELLTRFAETRDNAAFAELVRRHGPVVYRICLRLIGSATADDAFQATFLVLATRLNSAQAADSIGGWLVGVAGRVARQMRRSEQRRLRRQAAAIYHESDYSPNHSTELTEQFRILDEELTRLPDRLRGPVVRCLLQGRTQEQVAAELGHTSRTLRRRLDEARRVLRLRLIRRGVVPAVAVGLVAGAGAGMAAVPHGLEQRTVAIVFDFLNGGAALSSAPALLAKGLATTMLTRKVMQFAFVASLGLIGFGFVLADGKSTPAQTATPTDKTKPASAIPSAAVTPAAPQAMDLPYIPPTLKIAAQPNPSVVAPNPEKQPQLSWESMERTMRERISQIAQNDPESQNLVVVESICVRVPAGFCKRVGLIVDDQKGSAKVDHSSTAYLLSQREKRLFYSLLETTSRQRLVFSPVVTTSQGQTATVHMGSQLMAVTALEKFVRDGLEVYTPRLETITLGEKMTLTPTISADRKFVRMQIETEMRTLNGSPVSMPVVPAGATQTKKNEETSLPMVGPGGTSVQLIRVNVSIPIGETVVISGMKVRMSDKEDITDMLWIVTPYIVDKK
jgi:RNA polymerase sigma factor (sigma-70 family)